jgi:hypothetical protein
MFGFDFRQGQDVVPAWKRWSPFARPFARPPRCRRQSLALQGSRETSDRAKQTENDQYVEVRPLWCLPAKHIDLLPQDQIFRLQQCSDLKSEAKMPRISLSRSVIRPRAYPVRSLRLCRIEFSVHTGLDLPPLPKDAVRKSSVIRRTAKASRSEIEWFDRSRERRNHLHKYIRFCHRQRTALSATDKRRAICCGIELCTRGMSG